MSRTQVLLIGIGVVAGATLGGVLYHAASCKPCKDSRRDAKLIARASAERSNGAAHVRTPDGA